VVDDEQVVDRPDESAGAGQVADNSLSRLLTLSDGVFAIAMTLLALDLKVPDDLASHPSDAALRHALAMNSSSYWSFLVSFYVVANYWLRHRQLMRSVVAIHPDLIRDTLLLLFVVAAMPFPASLLGNYGSTPFSLVLYGATNVIALTILMVLSHDITRLHLGDPNAPTADYEHRWETWFNLGVFLLCIPAGYVLHGHGPYVLVLLALPGRLIFLKKLFVRRRVSA
jgi:uncharacterized membrane protein